MYMKVLFPGRERPDWACLLLSSAAWRLVRAAVSGLILVLKPWLGFSVTARSWFGLNALNASLILCLVDLEQNANSLWAAGSCKGKRLVLACTCTCMLVLTLLYIRCCAMSMNDVQGASCVRQTAAQRFGDLVDRRQERRLQGACFWSLKPWKWRQNIERTHTCIYVY